MLAAHDDLGGLLRGHRRRAGLSQDELNGDAGAAVEIGVLGPLVLGRPGAWLSVDQATPRTLLSLLALQPGEVVPVAAAIDVLWGDDPPRTCRDLIQVHIGRLRRTLDDHQLSRPGARSIRRVATGYLLDPAAVSVDVMRFDALFDRAVRAQAAGDPNAAAHFRDALRCWRGPVLADADHRLRHHPEAVRLARRRVDAAVGLADLTLPDGGSAELLGELRELCVTEPLHEGLRARLIRALAAAGEQAAALHTFMDLRDRLGSELGVSPAPDVMAAYLRVLRGPTASGERAGGSAAAEPVTPPGQPARRPADVVAPPDLALHPPAQLPANIDRFSGRVAALARLDEFLDTGRGARAVVITALSGTAGVGKTALAVRWAHRVRHRFPDGQFYVNLRGFHPTGAAVTPGEALHGFLTALGLPPARIPSTLDAQSALYRTLLADRRMLVLLDNARDAEQVRPLLPGAPGCLVLITSRHGLASLVATETVMSADSAVRSASSVMSADSAVRSASSVMSADSAVRSASSVHPVPLDLLTLDEARDLLAQRLGAARVAAEPGAVDVIVERCARLPLALAIAAARAAFRPHAPLADLAADLSERRGRLDALSTGEEGTDVRAVFSWSYRMLGPGAARLFRLLGLHPGADISAPAAASLAGLRPAQVAPLLAELTGAHLLAEPIPGRYSFHDLLQAYAADLAGEEDPAPVHRAALTRLFDHYLRTAETAVRVLFATGQPQPDESVPAIGPAAARAWLDTERANLIAAAGHGWPEHTLALATTLFRYLDSGYFNDALVLHTIALEAARQCDDPSAEAQALNDLGLAHRRSGRFAQAEQLHKEARTRYRQLGDRAGEARALSQLGIVSWRLGRYPQAEQQHQAALDLYREISDRLGEANQLNYFGIGNRQNGHIHESVDYHQQALTLFRGLNHRFGEADALDCLGTTYQQLGNHRQAIDCHRQAAATFREMGHRPGEACAINNLGYAFLRAGDPGAACEHHQRALTLCREIGERSFEIEATNGLGAALLAVGNPDAAHAHHTTALTLADRIGDRHEQATAHRGLANTYHTIGDTDRARSHWQHAQAIYADLGLPDADQVAQQIRDLDRTAAPPSS
jgi:DNA-binding SARP family transcriptional activator/tetratricopeptide (TPR) repeat protein